MKSRSRPPLTLSDPEPADLPQRPAASEEALQSPPMPEVAPERPMSERRRRRLLEQQRAADLEVPPPAEPEPLPFVAPSMAAEAEPTARG